MAYTKVEVPVPFHVIVPEPDRASSDAGKVPDPPVVASCEHELRSTFPFEALTTVQMAGTLTGPVVVVVPDADEVPPPLVLPPGPPDDPASEPPEPPSPPEPPLVFD
jgi:hypothetical protein